MKREDPDSTEAIRRRILRRLALFTYTMIAAAVVVAAGGAALVAWLLRPSGLPFRETWLACGVLIVGIPIAAHALRRRAERKDG